jgi:hypothetical protein
MIVAVLVKHRACEDEGGEGAKLNGFVEAIPDAVDAKADVKEGRAEPGEPYQREELEVVDQRWKTLAITLTNSDSASDKSEQVVRDVVTHIAHQCAGA